MEKNYTIASNGTYFINAFPADCTVRYTGSLSVTAFYYSLSVSYSFGLLLLCSNSSHTAISENSSGPIYQFPDSLIFANSPVDCGVYYNVAYHAAYSIYFNQY